MTYVNKRPFKGEIFKKWPSLGYRCLAHFKIAVPHIAAYKNSRRETAFFKGLILNSRFGYEPTMRIR